jgi:hypothetical protein
MKAQEISITTDVSLLHNFSAKEHFWTVGQTLQANIHINTKETFYAWLNYYKPARFHSSYTAIAKNPVPPYFDQAFTVNSEWRFRQISLGWKHYFLGGYNNYTSWNVYGLAGFGLLFNKVQNTYTQAIDTALYTTGNAPQEGTGRARRLTFDLGLGVELPVGGYTFLYADARTWVPASTTPSPYVYGSVNVPFPALVSVGVRILFGE